MKTVRNITLAIAASAGLVVAAAAFAADTPIQAGCQGERHTSGAERKGHGMQQHPGEGMRHMHGRAKGAEKQEKPGGEHEHS
jgi:hypothetical protein